MTAVDELPPTSRPARLALRVVQIGAMAVVAVVATLHVFELDRFFIPKELVLHLTALIAGLLVVRTRLTRIDLLLTSYLLLSVVSALFAANPWLAMRAVAISVSGVVIFWVARALREAGLERALLGTGFRCRAGRPTLLQSRHRPVCSRRSRARRHVGNRNFVPTARLRIRWAPGRAARAQRRRVSHGLAWRHDLTASPVLTRRSPPAGVRGYARRFLTPSSSHMPATADVAASDVDRDMAGCGVAAALLLPNTLRWRSDNPYLETVKRVADYQEGSGRGRLVQYEQSLRLAIRHPLLGVGPGNWSVAYPEHAVRDDPSMSDSDAGMTTNPWPSSDWVAIVTERGLLTAALLALAFLGIAMAGLRQLTRALDTEEGLLAAALLGTLVGAVVTGLFDAVLLLAVPTLIVWAALGGVAPVAAPRRVPLVLLAAIAIVALGAARSAMQLTAMQIYATRSDRPSLTRAAQIDPGNYRLRLRLARMGRRQQRCEHARAAHALFPNAHAARDVSRGCD